VTIWSCASRKIQGIAVIGLLRSSDWR
jgi:hypothetical protein